MNSSNMSLLAFVQEKFSNPTLTVIKQWQTERGEMGIFQEKRSNHMWLIIRVGDSWLYTNKVDAATLKDAQVIAAFAGAQESRE